MLIKVVPKTGAIVARSVEEDKLLLQRYFMRKICGSLATGAFFNQAWKLDTIAQRLALFRLEAILLYNLLDRGSRDANEIGQGAAIRSSIEWHVDIYRNVHPDLSGACPTPVAYKECLEKLISFRSTQYGVKAPSKGAKPDIQINLQSIGYAAWITQAIFLQNCFIDNGDGTVALKEVDFDEMKIDSLKQQIERAATSCASLSVDLLPSAAVVVTNKDIREATLFVLNNFVPPAPGNFPLENTFLTAGSKNNRGGIFRLLCTCIIVVSYFCEINDEPHLHERKIWLGLKHFNFMEMETFTVIPTAKYMSMRSMTFWMKLSFAAK